MNWPTMAINLKVHELRRMSLDEIAAAMLDLEAANQSLEGERDTLTETLREVTQGGYDAGRYAA